MPRHGIYLQEATFSRACKRICQTIVNPTSSHAPTILGLSSFRNKVNAEQVSIRTLIDARN